VETYPAPENTALQIESFPATPKEAPQISVFPDTKPDIPSINPFPAERPKELGDTILWNVGSNGTSNGNSSSFNNINRQIKMEYNEIISGNGTTNLDSNGNQKIYQGRENKSWTGAGEYDVLKRNKDGTLVYDSKGNPIETNNRILVKRDSSGNIIKIGYVEGHNYGQIKIFPTKE